MIDRKLSLIAASLALAGIDTAGAAVPFDGGAEGSATYIQAGPDGVVLTVGATGRASHLGLYTSEERIVLDPATGSFSGTIVLTAANGDRWNGIVEGGFVAPGSAGGTYTLAGGTGRFAAATGEAEFMLSTPDGVHFTVTFAGILSR